MLVAATKENEEEEEQVSVWRRRSRVVRYYWNLSLSGGTPEVREYLYKKTPIKYIMIYLLEEKKKKKKQKQICMVQSNVYDRPPFGKSPLRARRVATFSRFGRLEELTFHHFHHRGRRGGEEIEGKGLGQEEKQKQMKTGFDEE